MEKKLSIIIEIVLYILGGILSNILISVCLIDKIKSNIFKSCWVPPCPIERTEPNMLYFCLGLLLICLLFILIWFLIKILFKKTNYNKKFIIISILILTIYLIINGYQIITSLYKYLYFSMSMTIILYVTLLFPIIWFLKDIIGLLKKVSSNEKN